MFNSKIVADSVAENGARLTTFEVTFPRLILAEWNTHRVFSRNTASSRAIPVEKLMKAVEEAPYIPERFPKNQAGMANAEWLVGEEHEKAVEAWLKARDRALESVDTLKGLNVHKQTANRILEPFMWVTSVTSSTEWNNFFTLRANKETCDASEKWEDYVATEDENASNGKIFPAQPDIQKITYLMRRNYLESKPKLLKLGEWHLPYVSDEDKANFDTEQLRLLSAGRCGKVSYLTHGETNTPEKDIEIADGKMVFNKHWSPVEHPSTPLAEKVFCGNFRGWKQARKFYIGEDGE